MHLLADANVNGAYITALRSECHTVDRVVDTRELGATATDREIVSYATEHNAIVLTNDAKDFETFDSHPGVIIVPQTGFAAGEVAAAVARIERLVPDLSNQVLYATSWI